ncbi:MAG TPA: glutamate-5-semialdehyde dehydrogenase [Pyrinomonadaceae bacterium]|nr:glutamate-5-semialdehyde dehydrogenase [Pyrinomonadaceae bacterium]
MNTQLKNNVLKSLARLLGENKQKIIEANRLDLETCPKDDAVIYDRLKVDESKVEKMCASVESVIEANDPVGKVISSHIRPDGLKIENRAAAFGTILIIYEARPDVSIEAAIIALKAGNKILLKGGKEARNTNLCLADLWQRALAENGADQTTVKYLDISREETQKLICGEAEKFDLVIPRGGETLIDFVLKNAKVPVIVSGRGNNFAFVDAEADFETALEIIVNGKSRLSVCNALDKVLIDEKLPDLEEKINRVVEALHNASIEVFGDACVHYVNPSVRLFGDEETWFEEFLSAKMVVAVVADIAEAVEKINKYSGGHSAVIITQNAERAAQFMEEVDCAAVYHNASVRFTDGGEFGLGAEIAISTQKLHFRGPLGAEHLLTNKWFVFGDGQIRK